MSDIVSCPSCRRKLEAPNELLGQDVQCPTCGAAFVAAPDAPLTYPPPGEPARPRVAPALEPPPPGRRARRGRDEEDEYRDRPYDDYDDYDDRRSRRWPRRRDWAPHRASTVLTLGILSLVVCGPVLGPIAWALGQSDINEIRAGRMDPEGEGMTNAGKICGMVGTILSVTLIAFYFLVFVVLAGTAAAVR